MTTPFAEYVFIKHEDAADGLRAMCRNAKILRVANVNFFTSTFFSAYIKEKYNSCCRRRWPGRFFSGLVLRGNTGVWPCCVALLTSD